MAYSESASEFAMGPFIHGKHHNSQSSDIVDVVNPSTGQREFAIAAGNDADVDRAVSAARRAFEDGRWSEAAPAFRRDALLRFADLIAEHAGALDRLDAGEMGKPVGERFGSAHAAVGLMQFYAEAADKVTGDVYSSDKLTLVMQRRVPRGVIAAIVPWNFPAYNAILKIAPALAAGNCVVLKPSELSTRSALQLAELALEAGIPAGVLNVVSGLGETVGRALGLHRDVDMIAFTGSTEVGKWMLQYAGQSNMKTVLTECGGKSPHIVFDDGVDLDAAAEIIGGSLLINQGQLCSVGSRLLVEASIEKTLTDRIAARLTRIVMGDALDTRTTFGPLASATQCDRVMSYVRGAQTEGAELLCGGRRALEHSGGSFVEPTLFRVTAPNARIAQEEIFGPVLSIIPFRTEAEAIALANGTRYGLVAYAWTSDLSRGMRLVKAIRSTVFVNSAAPLGAGPGHACSAEPAGQSGVGIEGGLAGMEGYQRRQLVWFNHA